jgi:hypothetical protein
VLPRGVPVLGGAGVVTGAPRRTLTRRPGPPPTGRLPGHTAQRTSRRPVRQVCAATTSACGCVPGRGSPAPRRRPAR